MSITFLIVTFVLYAICIILYGIEIIFSWIPLASVVVSSPIAYLLVKLQYSDKDE